MNMGNLDEKDMRLIKAAMFEGSISIASLAVESKEEISTECYEREMKKADRLMYLINVLNGVVDYDR